MNVTLKEFVWKWMFENPDKTPHYTGEYGELVEIAFNMRDDIKPYIENFCPSNYEYEDWYDLFVDICIIPELQEIMQKS